MMKQWLKSNPWIWIIVFFLFVFGSNFALVILSILNAPINVKG